MAISIGDLNKALGQLRSQVNTFEATAKFQDASEGIEKAYNNPFSKLSQDHGTVVDGVKALGQNTDNLADEEEAKLKPMVTKLDPTISEKFPELKGSIGDASAMDKMFKSYLVNAQALYTAAKPAVTTEARMLDEIVQDGSLQSTVVTISDRTGKSLEDTTKELDKFKPENLTSDYNTLVKKVKSEEFQKEFSAANNKLSGLMDRFTGGFGSGGGLMKNLTEKLTSNISSATKSLDLPNVNSRGITSQVLSGDAAGARNILSSKVTIPSSLSSFASSFPGATAGLDGTTTFGNSKQLSSFLTGTKNKISDPGLQTQLGQATSKADSIFTKITDRLGSVGGAVTPAPETPTNNNPVVNYTTKKVKPYQLMNSTEEIVKYLQAANRELSTLTVGWTQLPLDNSNWTAWNYANAVTQAVGANATPDDPNYRPFQGDVLYGTSHFFIRKDGTLETARPIDLLRGYSTYRPDGVDVFGPYNVFVIFNAGYNCYRKKFKGGKIPQSELTAQSITAEQWKTFNMLLDAWYTFFPAGDAFGQLDLYKEFKSPSPGFDVPSYVGKAPWNKANTGEPKVLNRLLSPDEIAIQNKEQMLVKLREIRDYM